MSTSALSTPRALSASHTTPPKWSGGPPEGIVDEVVVVREPPPLVHPLATSARTTTTRRTSGISRSWLLTLLLSFAMLAGREPRDGSVETGYDRVDLRGKLRLRVVHRARGRRREHLDHVRRSRMAVDAAVEIALGEVVEAIVVSEVP